MPITALYAGLLTPLFVYLSVRVILARRRLGVALGDGGEAALLRRMRVQGNFAEYVPLAIILIGAAESIGTDQHLLHALGGGLVFGRLLHAAGVSQVKEVFALRVTGMAITMTVLLLAATAAVAGFAASA